MKVKEVILSGKYNGRKKPTIYEVEGEVLCPACGTRLTNEPGDKHVHHVFPVFEGGESTKYNMILICSVCHVILHHSRDDDERGRLIRSRIWDYMLSKYGLSMGDRRLLRRAWEEITIESKKTGVSILQISRYLQKWIKKHGEFNYLRSYRNQKEYIKEQR